MRVTGVFLTAALLAATAGGLVLAQVEQPVERAAAPPPSDGPAPPAAEPITPAPNANAVAPDEEAPPPPEMADEPEPKPAPVQNRVAAAAAVANTQEEEAPPPPPPPPLKRPRFAAAILQAVDKPTGDTLRFEAKVGQPIRYKGLTMTLHACETNAADDDVDDSMAHLEISSQPQVVAGRRSLPPRQVYRGWMFAASQGLHPLEHPIYDLWLIACKTDAPAVPGGNL